MNIKDFKWTEKRFGTRFANILKKLGGLSKDATDGSIEYKDEQGTVTKLVTDSNFGSLLAKNGLIEVKWQELKDKRDSGKLIPGSLYRITDYNCTTTQENTQSAGHQFDIVLLALSEDKLAEEGWAMMNESNIYDVTFGDGVKKCYIFAHEVDGETVFNVVDIGTMLGVQTAEDEIVIDEANKSATCYMELEELTTPDLPYNYFQNSNLSAWKVWYCLDNDKSRFAWADGSLDEGSPAYIEVYETLRQETSQLLRFKEADTNIDNVAYYGWAPEEFPMPTFTLSETPNSESNLFMIGDDDKMFVLDSYTIVSYTPPQEGTGLPNGRGVIYRLIDEWGNDVCYDFKNIVIYLGGKIEKGYLFSSDDGDIFGDMSLTGIFNDITVKKTIDDNNCQVIDMGILVADVAGFYNIIVAGGALSEYGVNTLSSNFIFGYTME